MKLQAIQRMVKNKVLLRGESGTGKTHCALMVSFLLVSMVRRFATLTQNGGVKGDS